MKFELLKYSGNHREGGTTYVAGDVIESDSDLAARFKNKFRKLDPNEGLPDVSELEEAGVKDPEDFLKKLRAQRTRKKAKKKTLKKLTKKAKDPRGVDSTKNFAAVKEEGLLVFRNGKVFSVYDGDEKKPLNEEGLEKANVLTFVKDYLEN